MVNKFQHLSDKKSALYLNGLTIYQKQKGKTCSGTGIRMNFTEKEAMNLYNFMKMIFKK